MKYTLRLQVPPNTYYWRMTWLDRTIEKGEPWTPERRPPVLPTEETFEFEDPEGASGYHTFYFCQYVGADQMHAETWGYDIMGRPNLRVAPQDGDIYIIGKGGIYMARGTLLRPARSELSVEFPEVFAAGEEYSGGISITNKDSSPSRFRTLLDTEVIDERTLGGNESVRFTSPPITMPYDDVIHKITVEALPKVYVLRYVIDPLTGYGLDPHWVDTGEFGREWLRSAETTVSVLAGFARAVFEEIDFPTVARPGERIQIGIPVRNTGYRGEVGLRAVGPGISEESMVRIDPGDMRYFTFVLEMPASEILRLTLTPISLGRRREVVEGAEEGVEIEPMNCLLHWDRLVTVRGGYRELNPVTGFVAGENLRITGFDTCLGIGGPPFLPYEGYILSGNLGPGDIARVEFDRLYYLRVDTERDIATACFGSLVDRAATVYEYSTLPTPEMMVRLPKAIAAVITAVTPSLKVTE